MPQHVTKMKNPVIMPSVLMLNVVGRNKSKKGIIPIIMALKTAFAIGIY
jgi:hypothetical protein